MKTLALFSTLSILAVLAACNLDAPVPAKQVTVSAGAWSKRAPMPIQIAEVAVTAAENKIYVIGGSTADVVDQNLNQEYDIVKDQWRNRAPLRRGLTHAAATSLNGKIYVIGAFTSSGHGNAVSLVHVYDPASDTWRTLAPLKSP